MAKRRFRPREEDRPVQELTPAERRALRKREKEGGKGTQAKGLGTPWRRAAMVGIPTAVIVAVVALLLLNPFHTAPPCLSLQDSPSGMPAFPAKGTTDFTGTWCPQNAPTVLVVHPSLKILIEGQTAQIPTNVGRNTNFTGYECDLPITTQTSLATGVLQIASPWPYIYNLSAFFYVWSQSAAGAYVNASHPSQPITYQSNNLLGFTTDPGHVITLFVDNQPSSAGPSLDLDTLPYLNDQYPTCLGTIYGTGHTIVLSYHSTHSAAIARGSAVPTLSTAPADPGLAARLWDSPMPQFGLGAPERAAVDQAHAASLAWFILRADA